MSDALQKHINLQNAIQWNNTTDKLVFIQITFDYASIDDVSDATANNIEDRFEELLNEAGIEIND